LSCWACTDRVQQNLEPGFPTRVFLTALSNNLDQKPLQWVATKDIGIFAVLAFASPDVFNHKAIGLAGIELNVTGLAAAFKQTTGLELVPTFWFLGSALTTLIGEMGTMIKWFSTDGYEVDIQKARKLHPNLLDMVTWIKEESKFIST
jgi:hypothetical protein